MPKRLVGTLDVLDGTLLVARFPVDQTETPTGPTLSLNGASFAAGAIITATAAGGPSGRYNWVGIFSTAGAFLFSASSVSWKYLNDMVTAPVTPMTGGTVRITAPSAPGSYVMRFQRNDSTQPYDELARAAFSVV